jgi:hypothetical protein
MDKWRERIYDTYIIIIMHNKHGSYIQLSIQLKVRASSPGMTVKG